ncbi:MAG: nicotinamide-nucleotide amidohydrolase family protein [Spirochaetes bacterium]|nr:nicotinamide-nucleotide amidohydrolase family protein [Spirochaetota bacterium]
MLKIALITVGDELISGKILNSNLKEIAEILLSEGIKIDSQFVVGDNEDKLVEVLNFCIKKFDIVIVSGGLGPTSDDITRFAASRFFEKPLKKSEHAYENLIRFYKNREMPDSNLIQTLIPEGSTPIENKLGTAAGFYYFYNKTHYYFIPGVPKEAIEMLKSYIIKDIKEKFNINNMIHNFSLFLSLISESKTYDILSNYNKYDEIKILFNPGFYPSHNFIKIVFNFTLNNSSINIENSLLNFLDYIINNLKNKIFFYSFDKNFLTNISKNSNNDQNIYKNFYFKIVNLNKNFQILNKIFYEKFILFLDNKNLINNENFNRYEYFKSILYNNQELLPAYIAIELLKNFNYTISTAESCTGGLIGSKLTNISGSSEVFKGGIIAYSNEIKKEILKIKDETLMKFGAVSKECVKEMAENVKNIFKSDVSIAVSGIAGPTGATPTKETGLVYYCINIKDNYQLFDFIFPFDRIINKERFANTGILLIISILEEFLQKNN